MRSEALVKAQRKYEESLDRIVVKFPKGYKDKIKKLATAKGFSNTSQYIKKLIDEDSINNSK